MIKKIAERSTVTVVQSIISIHLRDSSLNQKMTLLKGEKESLRSEVQQITSNLVKPIQIQSMILVIKRGKEIGNMIMTKDTRRGPRVMTQGTQEV